MTITIKSQSRPVLLAAAVLAGSVLAGCTAQTGPSGDRVGRLLVSPGKYEFYNCDQMGVTAMSLRSREADLRALMNRAGQGVVSSVAYGPEYSQVRGELSELQSAARAKNCNLAAAPVAAGEAVHPIRRPGRPPPAR